MVAEPSNFDDPLDFDEPFNIDGLLNFDEPLDSYEALNFYEDIDLDEPCEFPAFKFAGVTMTNDELEQIHRYLWKLKMRVIDFSISAAAWQTELPKLDKVITDIMVATAESEEGCGGVMLNYLERKARDCKEIILMHIGKGN
jgi:hypothetical protein